MSEESPKPLLVLRLRGYLTPLEELTTREEQDHAVIVGDGPAAGDITVGYHADQGVISIGDYVFPETVFDTAVPRQWADGDREFNTDLMGARLFAREKVNTDHDDAYTLPEFRDHIQDVFAEYVTADRTLATAPHVVVVGHFNPTGDYGIRFPEGEEHTVGDTTYPADAFTDGGGADALLSGNNILAGTTVFPEYALSEYAVDIADEQGDRDGE